jgi:hypothetical protein
MLTPYLDEQIKATHLVVRTNGLRCKGISKAEQMQNESNACSDMMESHDVKEQGKENQTPVLPCTALLPRPIHPSRDPSTSHLLKYTRMSSTASALLHQANQIEECKRYLPHRRGSDPATSQIETWG